MLTQHVKSCMLSISVIKGYRSIFLPLSKHPAPPLIQNINTSHKQQTFFINNSLFNEMLSFIFLLSWICLGLQHPAVLWHVLSRGQHRSVVVMDTAGWRQHRRHLWWIHLRQDCEEKRDLRQDLGPDCKPGELISLTHIWRVSSQNALYPFWSIWDIWDLSCWNIKKIIRKFVILLIITSKIFLYI